MKKLLVFMLVLAMTSFANAGLIDVVMTGYNDVDGSGTITASDIIDIAIVIQAPGALSGYDLDLHVTGPGTLGDTGGTITQLQGTAGFNYYSGIIANSIAHMADVTFGVMSAGTIIQGLSIHADGQGEVLVDLTIAGDTLDNNLGLLTDENLGDLAITVVPEPMTIALLGLGGLFLRRRK